MTHDPIVEEIRAIREQLAASLDFDIARIVADAQKRQASSGRRIIPTQTTPAVISPAAPPQDQNPGNVVPT